MGTDKALSIYIGWDSREPVATSVCEHSIRKRTKLPLQIHHLKHRDLRKTGHFIRPWLIESDSGEFVDLIDNKKFSTEFSHTRFLVPSLMKFKGWALFTDSDILFMCDVAKLLVLADEKYAVMCVKHNHNPTSHEKMDGREQQRYHRKNWSSFVLWNCSHPANRILTEDYVNTRKGGELHAFSWLHDDLIGSLPPTFNYIHGVSPKMVGMPDVIHFTEGGPWFENCKDVAFAGTWMEEYEDMQVNGKHITEIPSLSYEKEEVIRK